MHTADLEFWEIAVRLGVAALIAGAIGLQREYDGQDAGFRTHVLVALGAALFGVVSVAAFDEFIAARGTTNVSVDVTRIAAYVAPGVGFIGGGAILKHGGRVSGITTAASLWGVAAIGTSAGLGFWQGAVVTGVLALAALALLEPVSDWVGRLGRRRSAAVEIELAPDADLGAIVAKMSELAGQNIRELRYGIGPDDDGKITVGLWRDRDGPPPDRLIAEISHLPGIRTATSAANV